MEEEAEPAKPKQDDVPMEPAQGCGATAPAPAPKPEDDEPMEQ